MAAQPLRNRSRWSLDFTKSGRAGGSDTPSPPGFSSSINAFHAEASRQSDPSLRAKRSWDLALGPIKQVPMNLFMMYTSGNTIEIYPIMTVVMMVIGLIKTLFSVNATFKALDNVNDCGGGMKNLGQKCVFLLGILVGVALALWKCHGMGLLPTHTSDWLSFANPVIRAEWAYA